MKFYRKGKSLYQVTYFLIGSETEPAA